MVIGTVSGTLCLKVYLKVYTCMCMFVFMLCITAIESSPPQSFRQLETTVSHHNQVALFTAYCYHWSLYEPTNRLVLFWRRHDGTFHKSYRKFGAGCPHVEIERQVYDEVFVWDDDQIL